VGAASSREIRGITFQAQISAFPTCYSLPPVCNIATLLMRGGAVWQLVGLITRRSQVQILPPLPKKYASPLKGGLVFFCLEFRPVHVVAVAAGIFLATD
jgi:hypothetical protein